MGERERRDTMMLWILVYSTFVHTATALRSPQPQLITNDAVTASGRRRFLFTSTTALTISSWAGGRVPTPWLSTASAESIAEVPMKLFVDTATPSLFTVEIPQQFFAIRRTLKGDLPDPKTGQGRRGGTIFSAGDMSKAEILGVERFPVVNLLEEEGIYESKVVFQANVVH